MIKKNVNAKALKSLDSFLETLEEKLRFEIAEEEKLKKEERRYLTLLEDEVEEVILNVLREDLTATEAKVEVDSRFLESATRLLQETLRYGIDFNQENLRPTTNENIAQNEIKVELTIRW